jgi:crotonobetainyl-CoA:carnitine CoA-transferase CaiB-like acyl-CoA transferase
MLLYGPYIDYIASLFGASAAMAAVIRSRRSGKGALIDLSQYESGLMFMGAALHDFFATGHLAERCGNDDPDAVPHGAYQCSDGEWVTLSCWSEEEFGTLAQVIGHPELVRDVRFATAASRRTNTKALDALISAWTARRSAEAAAESLQAIGLAAYPVVTMAGLFRDPQLFARGQFRVRRHPEMGDPLLLSRDRSPRLRRMYRRTGSTMRSSSAISSACRRMSTRPIAEVACSIDADPDLEIGRAVAHVSHICLGGHTLCQSKGTSDYFAMAAIRRSVFP